MNKKFIFILLLSCIVGLLITPFIGTDLISISDIFSSESILNEVFWKIRLPRVLTGFIAGAGLSMAGLVFQSMFRNDLATPYTLGIASGASFGNCLFVVLSSLFGLSFFLGASLFSFLGALVCIFLVYLLSSSRNKVNISSLLLAGVVIGMFFSSAILLFQFFANERDSFKIIRWLMGAVDVVGFSTFYIISPVVIVSLIFSLTKVGELNLMSLGDEIAVSRGVDIEKVRKYFFVLISLMVAVIVSECGPIAFVGLIVPHTLKKIVGHNHINLIPSTFLAGGIFLVLCDLLSRTILTDSLLPVGVITSLLGGPFFLYILIKSRTTLVS